MTPSTGFTGGGIAFSQFNSTGALNKYYDENGKKTSRANMHEGTYQTKYAHSVLDFFQQQKQLLANQAIAIGVAKVLSGEITTTAKASNKAISRTKENFSMGDIGFLLVDCDPNENGFQITSPEHLVEVMRIIDPLLNDCEIGVKYGSSSGIHKNGVLINDKKSMHGYIIVKNASDEKLKKYKDFLEASAWAKGYGHIELSKSGAILKRQVFDGSVFSPERLIFEAEPTLAIGITRVVPEPYIAEGSNYRDLNNIPTPPVEGKQKFLAEKVKYATKSKELKTNYVETEVQKIVTMGGEESVARTAILSKVENQILHPYDCVLSNENLLIQISMIIENPEKFDGMYIRDPIDPDKGRNKAIINAKDGKVSIYAFRHGGIHYQVTVNDSSVINHAQSNVDNQKNMPVVVANSNDLVTTSIPVQNIHVLTTIEELKTHSSTTDNGTYINQFSNTLIQKLQYRGRFNLESIVEQVLKCGIPIMANTHSLYLYLEDYWQKHEHGEIEKKVFIKGIIEKITGKRASSQQVDKVFKELHYEYDDEIAYNGDIISYSNCVLIIENGKFTAVEHNPKFGLKYKLRFPYLPTATCLLMDNFLMDVIGEEEAINVFWEYIGSAFIKKDDYRLEKAMFLLGQGSNGKSVLLDVLKELFGKVNISSVPLNEMSKPERRQAMVAKLFNIAAEGDDKKLNAEVFKTIVAREPMSVKVLYHNPVETEDFPRLIFATNHLPTTTDTSRGMARRFIIIYFSKVIPDAKQDKQLFKKLCAELSGIMNRVLEGMTRLLSNENQHLTYSKIIDRAGKQFEGQNNPVKYFVGELEFEKQDAKASIYCSSQLYVEFKNFCEEEGIRQELTKKAFVGLMKEIFGQQDHSNKLYGWRIKKKMDLTPNSPEQSPYE